MIADNHKRNKRQSLLSSDTFSEVVDHKVHRLAGHDDDLPRTVVHTTITGNAFVKVEMSVFHIDGLHGTTFLASVALNALLGIYLLCLHDWRKLIVAIHL